MVRGLDLFRDYFKDYTDKYILIGGTACDLAMETQKRCLQALSNLVPGHRYCITSIHSR